AQSLPAQRMAVLDPRAASRVECDGPARFVVIGGESVGPRYLYWNFVSSRKERILQASADWEQGRFDPVPGETEFIPLPPTRFTPAEPMS
ncbi:MAG: pirin-like C-terminal cupin domain-containing protein, partial [Ramlibacter sp.]